MKKLSKIIIVCMIIMITLSTILFLNKKEVIYKEERSKENNLISFMIENEEGKYVKAKENAWPDSEYFVLNQELSGCENGGTLAWNTEKEKVEASLSTSDKCYAYFTFNKEKYVRDLSGNNNHGKLNNIVSWNEEGLTTSDENKVGYVNCGLEGYDFKNSISLVARVRVNKFHESSGENHQRILNNYPPKGGGGTGLVYNISNLQYHFYISSWTVEYNGWRHLTSTSPTININTWYTLVGTYDGNTEKIYIDGKLSNSLTFSENINTSDLPFLLGKSEIGNSNGQKSDSTFATYTDVLIYNRALTDNEIAQDFTNKINPTNKQGLLLYYKFV